MADYKLQTRIPQELADKLFNVIKEVQEKTTVADVTTSSITRASLETFISDYENKKNRKKLIIELPNDVSTENLQRFYEEINVLSDKALKEDNAELCLLYSEITSETIMELLKRKKEEIEKNAKSNSK